MLYESIAPVFVLFFCATGGLPTSAVGDQSTFKPYFACGFTIVASGSTTDAAATFFAAFS
jgi:hypothetical protein